MPLFELAPIQVGRLTIDFPVSLAPMAGVTNWPFRLLCKEKGCGFVVTEFVSDKALLFDSKRTQEMIQLLPGERPAAVQIFGADPETMAKAAAKVVELENPDFIDINMGCPAPKVTKGRGGSSLLKEPDVAEEIVRQVIREVGPIPVTVKMRIGWDSSTINAIEMGQRVEAAGAQMLTIHGRTREQHYSGNADWDVIDSVARAITIPVIGNGDITTPEQALHRLKTTAVRGLAIGRGAMGNPWLFGRLRHYLATGELLPEPAARERIETTMRHFDLMIEYRGEYIATREMRKHAAWYLKGLWGSAEARAQINTAETSDELRSLLWAYLERYEAYKATEPEALVTTEEGPEAPQSCDAFADEESCAR
ncbi:MAG TPA: tRNA dihydrouridine synthase DusB [Symbiobacteriaceae bacterium]|nr:tRNA dihydrouridine synthase DusB [Symbiobacteriaceae bacterium]